MTALPGTFVREAILYGRVSEWYFEGKQEEEKKEKKGSGVNAMVKGEYLCLHY